MKLRWGGKFARSTMGALIVVGCAYAGIRLMAHPASLTLASTQGAQSAEGDVSEAEQQTLDSVLASIPGLQEVALANDGNGTSITATVDLPYGTQISATSTVSASLMQEYLQDAFAADSNLEQAQLFFVQDGQIVAGGALNRSAFNNWTVGVTTGKSASGLLSWMASLHEGGASQMSSNTPSGWFEIESPVVTEGE